MLNIGVRGLIPAVGDKMPSLPLGTIPTYQRCVDDTQDASGASTIPQTTFCLVEPGKIAGVIVMSRSSTNSCCRSLSGKDLLNLSVR
jgi:hypothetical protein